MENSKIIKSKKDRDFTMIDNVVLKNEKLSWAAKGLYCYLVSLPGDWVYYKSEVQKHSSNGRAAFETAWDELEKNGYLVGADMIRAGGKFGGREFIFYALTEADKAEILKNLPLSVSNTPLLEISNGTVAGNQQLLSTKNTTNTNIQKQPPLELPFSSLKFKEAWEEWEAYRKAIKKRLTPFSIKKQYMQLAEYGEADAIKSIEQSIKNTWTGLFPLKEDRAQGKLSLDIQGKPLPPHLQGFVQ